MHLSGKLRKPSISTENRQWTFWIFIRTRFQCINYSLKSWYSSESSSAEKCWNSLTLDIYHLMKSLFLMKLISGWKVTSTGLMKLISGWKVTSTSKIFASGGRLLTGQQSLWKEFTLNSLTDPSPVKFIRIFCNKFLPWAQKIISFENSTLCKTKRPHTELKKCLKRFSNFFVTVWLDLDTLSLLMVEWNGLFTAQN